MAVVFTRYSPETKNEFPDTIAVKDRTHRQVIEYAKTSDRIPEILRNNVWCSKELDDEYEIMRMAGHGPAYFARYYGFYRVVVLIVKKPSYDVIEFRHWRTGEIELATMTVEVQPWMYSPSGKFWRTSACAYRSDGYRQGKKSSEMYDESMKENIDGIFYDFQKCYEFKEKEKRPDFEDEVYE